MNNISITDDRSHRLHSPLRQYHDSEYRIPDSSGAQVYVFNAEGRHLRTVAALTGADVYTFK